MTLPLIKKAALSGFILFFVWANPFPSTATVTARFAASPDESMARRIAELIADETPPEVSPETSGGALDHLGISRHIVRLSREEGIDPLLVLAMIKVESGFKPGARSYRGAVGLMQVMPIVIREVGSEVGVLSRSDLYDPYQNIRLGIRYFNFLKNKYRDNLPNALAAYNLGPTALDLRLARQGSAPTAYYRKVVRCYEDFLSRLIFS